MKYSTIVCLVATFYSLLFINYLKAQNTSSTDFFIKGERTYYFDFEEVLLLPDGGRMLFGSRNNPNALDYALIKTDKFGNQLWTKLYGGNEREILRSVIQLDDGGFLIGGLSNSNATKDKSQRSRGGYDYWVLRLDAEGDLLWEKTYGGNKADNLISMIKADDGYVLAGSSASGISGEKSEPSYFGRESTSEWDYWVVKIDLEGNKMWDRTIGGTGEDRLNIAIALDDGNILLGGSSSSPASGDKSVPNRSEDEGGRYFPADIWIYKMDQSGNKIWDRAYGGKDLDLLTHMVKLDDASFLMSANSSSGISGEKSEPYLGGYDCWILKIDKDGDLLWDKTIGGGGSEWARQLIPLENNEFILASTSISNQSLYKSEDSRGSTDYWVVKMDANANIVWEKTIGGERSEGIGQIIPLSTDDYLIFGGSQSRVSGDKSLSLTGTWVVNLEVAEPNEELKALLIDAHTDKVIMEIENGATIDLNEFDMNYFDIKVIQKESGVYKSFEMALDGPVKHRNAENIAPYALFKDQPKRFREGEADFLGSGLLAGQYTLTVRPNLENHLKGEFGDTFSVDFNVIGEAPPAIKRLVVVDTETGAELGDLDLYDPPKIDISEHQNLSVIAELHGKHQGSVLIELIESPFNHKQVENIFPYTLFGDDYRTDELNSRSFSCDGYYSVRATSYLGKKLTGATGYPFTAKFQATGGTPMVLESLTLINAKTNEPIGELTDGMEIIDTGEGFSIRADVNSCVNRVRFVVRSANSTIISRDEKFAPYTLLGDTPDGDYKPWYPEPGDYSLLFSLLHGERVGQSLFVGRPPTINFSVIKADQNTEMKATLYPNPSQGSQLHVTLNSEQAFLQVFDKQGSLVFEKNTTGKEQDLDLSHLSAGYYIMHIQTDKEVTQKTILIR